jgi:hypothetical protein
MTAVTPAEGAEDGLRQFQLVRFNHEQNGGPVHRIMSVMRDGMVKLHDMGGYFAPHLFVVADDIGDIPPSPASPDDAAALAEARAEVERLKLDVAHWRECATSHMSQAFKNGEEALDARDKVAALEAENAAMRAALEDIGVYGCGMLNQPAAMNAPAEVWLSKRIRRMEDVARAALVQSSGGEVGS